MNTLCARLRSNIDNIQYDVYKQKQSALHVDMYNDMPENDPRYTVKEKNKIIKQITKEVDEGSTLTVALEKISAVEGLSVNTMENWYRPTTKLKIEQAMNIKTLDKQTKKLATPESWFPTFENEVMEVVRAERAQGKAVGYTQLLNTARNLNGEKRYQHDLEFTLHWTRNVAERNGMTLRAPQNTRKEGVAAAIPKVLAFHNQLCTLCKSKWTDLVSLYYILL